MPAPKDPAKYPVEFFKLYNKARVSPEPIEIKCPTSRRAMTLRSSLHSYRNALKAHDPALYREFSAVMVSLEQYPDGTASLFVKSRSATAEATLIRGALGEEEEETKTPLPLPSFHQQVEDIPGVPFLEEPSPMVAEQNTRSTSATGELLKTFGFTAENTIQKLPGEDE